MILSPRWPVACWNSQPHPLLQRYVPRRRHCLSKRMTRVLMHLLWSMPKKTLSGKISECVSTIPQRIVDDRTESWTQDRENKTPGGNRCGREGLLLGYLRSERLLQPNMMRKHLTKMTWRTSNQSLQTKSATTAGHRDDPERKVRWAGQQRMIQRAALLWFPHKLCRAVRTSGLQTHANYEVCCRVLSMILTVCSWRCYLFRTRCFSYKKAWPSPFTLIDAFIFF